MFPLITAALGLIQQNKKDQEQRKQQQIAATMGQFNQGAAPSGPSASGGDALGALTGLLGQDKQPDTAGKSDELLDPWA